MIGRLRGRLAEALPGRKQRLIATGVSIAAALALVVITRAVLDSYAQSTLSRADQRTLGRSLSLVDEWCLARRRPNGGSRRLERAIDTLVKMAEQKPRRRTDPFEGAFSTVRQATIDEARGVDGTCRRRVPGAQRLRAEVVRLAETREGDHAKALTASQIRTRLQRRGASVHMTRARGPAGVKTYRVRLTDRVGSHLDVVVVTGPGAVQKVRAFGRPLLRHEANVTAIHPVNGLDSAVIRDSRGLQGAPYTVDAGTPLRDRTERKRRGDLRDAAEFALVGEVGP